MTAHTRFTGKHRCTYVTSKNSVNGYSFELSDRKGIGVNSKYENCHLLSCISLDDTCIESGFIHVVNPDADNHRLSNSKLLLNQFRVHLIDDQFRKILFQQKTYVSLQIVLSPYVSP